MLKIRGVEASTVGGEDLQFVPIYGFSSTVWWSLQEGSLFQWGAYNLL